MQSVSRANEPKLLFIGTASEDAEVYIHRIHEVFEKLSCEVRELSLTKVKLIISKLMNYLRGRILSM